jgi:hypothetical protein
MSMTRSAIAAIFTILLACSLSGCDDLKKMVTGCSSQPVDNNSPHSVLGIGIGMARADAEKIMGCVENGEVSQGTSGASAQEADTILSELKTGGYANLLIVTDATKRDCAARRQDGNDALDGILVPDDVRFADYLLTGNSFPCYSVVRQQIVAKLGGPPGAQQVIGIWRLFVPAQGERPQLAQLLEDLKGKYPALSTETVPDSRQGFLVAGFEDEADNTLDPGEIQAGYLATPPVEPTAPATTEACGLLWLDTCSRPIPQSEQDAYQSARSRYGSDLEDYQRRKQKGDRYAACIGAVPRRWSDPSLRESLEEPCGIAYFAAARPLPGGFASGFFVGLYDPALAARLKASFDDYIRSKRPELESTTNRAATL